MKNVYFLSASCYAIDTNYSWAVAIYESKQDADTECARLNAQAHKIERAINKLGEKWCIVFDELEDKHGGELVNYTPLDEMVELEANIINAMSLDRTNLVPIIKRIVPDAIGLEYGVAEIPFVPQRVVIERCEVGKQ